MDEPSNYRRIHTETKIIIGYSSTENTTTSIYFTLLAHCYGCMTNKCIGLVHSHCCRLSSSAADSPHNPIVWDVKQLKSQIVFSERRDQKRVRRRMMCVCCMCEQFANTLGKSTVIFNPNPTPNYTCKT